MQYWLKWKGYPDSDNTWEPESNLNCCRLLQKYKKGHNLLPSKPAKSKTLTKKTNKVPAKRKNSTKVHGMERIVLAAANHKKSTKSSSIRTKVNVNPTVTKKKKSMCSSKSSQEKYPSKPQHDHKTQDANNLKKNIVTEPQLLCEESQIGMLGMVPNASKQNGFHVFPHALPSYPTVPASAHHGVYIPNSGYLSSSVGHEYRTPVQYVVYVNSHEENGRTLHTHHSVPRISTPNFNPTARLGFNANQLYSPPSPPISPTSSPLIVDYTPPKTKSVPLSLQLDSESESDSSVVLENSDLKLHLSSPSTCSATSTPNCSPVSQPLTFPCQYPINPLFFRQYSPLTSPLLQQQFLSPGSPTQSVFPNASCTPTRQSEPQNYTQVSLFQNHTTKLNHDLKRQPPSVAIKKRNRFKSPTYMYYQQKGGGASMPLPRSLHKQQGKCFVPTKAAKGSLFGNSGPNSETTECSLSPSHLKTSTKVSHKADVTYQGATDGKGNCFKVIAAHPTQPKITIARIDPHADNAATLNYKNQLMEWQYRLNNQRGGTDEYIIVENEVDHEPPPKDFTYISSNIYREGVPDPSSPEVMGSLCGCECYIRGKKCGQKSKICCSHMAGAPFAYTTAGKVCVEPGTPIFECNSQCLCPADCANRVVQHGRKIPLCIFRTSNERGWGVKTIEAIKPKTFVTEYVGEVIVNLEAEKRGKLYDAAGQTYLFDLDFEDENAAFTIDAAKFGNISHFFNHSVRAY